MNDSKVVMGEGIKEHLVDRAVRAKDNAYAPYSEYPVGAAVFAEGHIFDGANIEIGGRMGSVHAEMLAVYKAMMNGNRDIDAIAVSTDNRDGDMMCSLCQHVISEFSEEVMILCDEGDGYTEHSLKDELGDAWRPGSNRDWEDE